MRAHDGACIIILLPCISPILIEVIPQLNFSESNLKSGNSLGFPLFIVQSAGYLVLHSKVKYVMLNLVHFILTNV